jgi:hypothetical protein
MTDSSSGFVDDEKCLEDCHERIKNSVAVFVTPTARRRWELPTKKILTFAEAEAKRRLHRGNRRSR